MFTTIYDEIIAAIKANMPERLELINPYDIVDNNDLYLKNGFGVEIGPLAKSEAFNRAIRQFQRTVTVSLTARVASTDKNVTVRKTREKELVSDQLLLIQIMMNSLSSEYVEFISDNGIEYIFDQRDDYLRLRTTFIINYNEVTNGIK